METIPLVYLKNRKIHIEKEGEILSFDDFLEPSSKYENIYFLDLDGIQDDKPNLCTYQKMPSTCTFWVDAGPRAIGDVVDLVVAGAANIVLRKQFWPQLDVSKIREITENGIYLNLEFEGHNEYFEILTSLNNADGAILLNEKKQLLSDFKTRSLISDLTKKFKTFIYDSDLQNYTYWKDLGVEGLLIDFKKKIGSSV